MVYTGEIMAGRISNYDVLATTPLRKDALAIVESAYAAIDTADRVRKNCRLEGSVLSLGAHTYDLDSFEHVYIIGFGKASCTAAGTLEEMLRSRVTSGLVIDKSSGTCGTLEAYQGTHPVATAYNVELSEKVVALAEKAGERDLVIVIVSGGGSSLLCYPLSEYKQGKVLYERFLSTGGTISELNTLRKHISSVKGGGLAKMFYPATVAALVFSDIPSDNPDEAYKQVASGPTYQDTTTTEDAKALLQKYHIEDVFTFTETPKKDVYFEKVTNIPMVSNVHAVQGMEKKAKELGYAVIVQSIGEYREASLVLQDMKAALGPKTVVIVAGEPSVVVRSPGDASGRSEYAAAKALSLVEEGQLCIPFATDGIDNKSEAAGVIVDTAVVMRAHEHADIAQELSREEQYDEIFKALGARIVTGPTGSNVSDCILFMQE
jgi:glycerate-2-kinase